MRKRLILTVFMVVTLAAGLVAACAAPAPAPAPAPTPAPAPAPAPTPTPAPAVEVIEWKAQSCFPTIIFTYGGGAERWAKRVEELSGGRLVVNMVPGGELVPAWTEWDAVVERVLDCAHATPPGILGKFPVVGLTNPAMATFDAEEALKWFYAGGGNELVQEVYGDNVKQVLCGIVGAEGLCWSNTPILELEDWKGVKFRTAGFFGDVLTKLGASVVSLPGGEVVPALQRGTLDAAEFSTPTLDLQLGFHEVAKYYIMPGIHQPSAVQELWINWDAWNELSPDLQAIVEAAAAETVMKQYLELTVMDSKAFEEIIGYGVEILTLSPEVQTAMRDMAWEIYEEKAKEDAMFAKVWKSMKDFMVLRSQYKAAQTFEFTD